MLELYEFKEHYREPTEAESRLIYEEEKNGYIRTMVRLTVLSILFFLMPLILFSLTNDFFKTEYDSVLTSPEYLTIIVAVIIALLTFIIYRMIFFEKNMEAFANNEYMVMPALYVGSEKDALGEDRRLCFVYGDGLKLYINDINDRYFRHCSHCLIVKRYDNKKGFVLRNNPDVVRSC